MDCLYQLCFEDFRQRLYQRLLMGSLATAWAGWRVFVFGIPEPAVFKEVLLVIVVVMMAHTLWYVTRTRRESRHESAWRKPVGAVRMLEYAAAAAVLLFASTTPLSTLQAAVLQRRLRNIASKPLTSDSTKSLQNALAAARSDDVKIPPSTVAEIGDEILQKAEANLPQPAQSALDAVVGYRSFLNAFLPERSRFQAFLQYPIYRLEDHGQWIESAPGVTFISFPVNLGSERGPGTLYGGSRENPVQIRNFTNVLFLRCDVRYDGSPIRLENVYFEDCRFTISDGPYSRQFVEAVLRTAAIDRLVLGNPVDQPVI